MGCSAFYSTAQIRAASSNGRFPKAGLISLMTLKAGSSAPCLRSKSSRPPKWIKPQLTRLVDEAPMGQGWLHEIKYDGYLMHAWIDAPRPARQAAPLENIGPPPERLIGS